MLNQAGQRSRALPRSLLCVLTLLSGSGLQAENLSIGWNGFIPYSYAEAGTAVTGYAVELIDMIAREDGNTLTFRTYPDPAALVEALALGQADVGLALVPSVDRSRVVLFSRPIGTLRIRFFALADRAGDIDTANLEGKRLGFAHGSHAGKLASAVPGVIPRDIQGNDALVLALLSGEVDAVVYPEDGFWRMAMLLGLQTRFAAIGSPLVETPISLAVSPARADIVDRLDRGIARLRDSGALAQLQSKWFVAEPPFWTRARLGAMALLGLGIALVSAICVWMVNTVRMRNALRERLRQQAIVIGKSQRFLETAFRTFQEPVILMGQDGRVKFKSQTIVEYLGYPGRPDYFAALPPELEAWDTDRNAPLAEADRPSLRALAGESVFDKVLRLRDAAGEYRFLSLTAVPIRSVEDQTRSVLLYTRDVTTERAARLSAEAADRVKSQFLAVMSHEIRTPLNAILGMFELIGCAEIPERQRRMAHAGFVAAERLLSQLTDILEVSRLEARAVEFRPRTIILADLVTEWETMFRAALATSGKRIGFRVLPCLGAEGGVQLDDARVTQVVNNLLDNALKFTEAGEIRLTVVLKRAEAAEPRLLVRVSDTGPGIAAKEQARVFDLFAQADPPVYSRRSGSGIGLSISRNLAELMGGTLTLQSRPGKGSAFTLCLPTAIADAGKRTGAGNDQTTTPWERPDRARESADRR